MGIQVVRVGRLLGAVMLTAATVAVGGAIETGAAAAATGWEVSQLQPLAAGDITTVFDINENGVAVGDSDFLPVLWEADGDVVPLALPEGYVAGFAVALNDDNQIVGAVYDADGNERAVAWSGGSPQLLGVNDVVVAIGDAGVMLGLDVSGFNPQTECCTSAFLEAIGGQHVALPPATGWLVVPRALSNNGLIVGSALHGATAAATGVGWYLQFVFPLGGTGSSFLQPIDVIGAPAVLVARGDGAGASSAIVTSDGQVTPLAHPSPIDLAADLNDHGVAVGAGGTSFETGPEVGRLYVYGSAVALDSLVDPEDHAGFDLDDPIALNNAYWIVGNSADGSSWLLRPAGTGPAAAASPASAAPAERAAPEGDVPAGHRGEPDLPVEPPLGWNTASRR